MSFIEMNHIGKSFGNLEVLKDVSLHMESGEVVSIIGPSGSGKSTFLRCLCELEKIDKGDICVGEEPASSQADVAPASGYEMGTAGAGDSRASGVDPYSGHNFGGSSPDWVDEEPEDNEDAWQLTGR